MSEILKTLPDHMVKDRTTWWVILDCGHWYHWTGDKAPRPDGDFPCPSCAPEPTIVIAPFPSEASKGKETPK